MGLFKKTPVPTEMTLDQFIAKAGADANFAAFSAKFGARLTTLTLSALYDRSMRMLNAAGIWDPAAAPDYGPALIARTTLKVMPADMQNFDLFLTEQMRQDVAKTNAREAYIANLKAEAIAGQLRARLDANTQPEGTYYTAAPPAAPQPGVPAKGALPASMVNQSKAIGWAVGDPAAAALVRGIYQHAFNAHKSRTGSFPIDSMETISAIGRALVPGSPLYRAVNILQPTNYPSSIAGAKLVKDVIADFATVAKPPVGDPQWYDWALYFFASIMTAQSFTDGNKRVSRLVYGLVLAHGQVPFKAPNNVLGAQLGDM